jgi:hypothetical protein
MTGLLIVGLIIVVLWSANVFMKRINKS